MVKGPKPPGKAIHGLLEEKVRLEQWLRRLDLAADQTPPRIQDRVRGDYTRRLEAVLKELEGYRAEMQQAVARQRQQREELQKQEAELSERLAEADVRHAVGEYDEEQWAKVRTDVLESLVKLREELKHTDEEIAALEEITATTLPAAAREPERADEREAPASAEQTDAFDELAFLRSVGRERPRPSGAAAEPSVGASGVRPVEPEGGPSKGTAKRTLKCTECGVMNLPTEWYCENCGAELAAL